MFLFGVSLIPAAALLPMLIFVAELSVVTISTVRIIFISRGMKVLAPILGFFEITIWLFAIGQIMQNLSDLSCYVAFAAGFTLGNLLGLILEKRLAIGTLVVRIITNRDVVDLCEMLKKSEYGVTALAGQGATGPVTVLLVVVKRKELANVVALIKAFNPTTFYSIDEVQSAASGIFRAPKKGTWEWAPNLRRIMGFETEPAQPVYFQFAEEDNGMGRRMSTSLNKST